MNPHDQSNPAFLISLDRETFQLWWMSSLDADHHYALELLDEYQQELDSRGAKLDAEGYPAMDVSLAKKALDEREAA